MLNKWGNSVWQNIKLGNFKFADMFRCSIKSGRHSRHFTREKCWLQASLRCVQYAVKIPSRECCWASPRHDQLILSTAQKASVHSHLTASRQLAKASFSLKRCSKCQPQAPSQSQMQSVPAIPTEMKAERALYQLHELLTAQKDVSLGHWFV